MNDFELTAPSDWQVRDFHGYKQWREGAGEKWRFNVSGFCWDDKNCHVTKTDGTEGRVPIDKSGRILIEGKWYSDRHWTH